MGKGKSGGENSKKAAGNAKKAANAAAKAQKEAEQMEREEASKWDEGSKKKNLKKEEEQAKKEEAARKKRERDEMLAAEEKANPLKSRGAAKVAAKRAGKIDDFLGEIPELLASGLDDALAALALTGSDGGVANKDIDRHPERRVKAAYAAFEERRMPEIRKEQPGLRQQQYKNLLFKEFKKSLENPMNQDTNVLFNASRDEVMQKRQEVRDQREKKYTR